MQLSNPIDLVTGATGLVGNNLYLRPWVASFSSLSL
jgi:hypothetical protein